MQHASLIVAADEIEFHHELTSVAHTQRQCILTGIEFVQRLLCFRIVEEGSSPSLCTAQYVGIGESATEHDELYLLQRLASGDEVGHHHILHIEAGKIEHPCHLTLAVGAFLTYDGSLRTGSVVLLRFDTVLRVFTCEAGGHLPHERLLLVVVEALLCFAVLALVCVHEIAALIPHVAQSIDVEGVCLAAFLHADAARSRGLTYIYITHTGILERLLYLRAVGVCHLNDNTWILGKQYLHDVLVLYLVELYGDTVCCVCEAHLKKAGDETACGDVVTGEDETLLDEFLHRVEGIPEVFGVGHRGNVVAHLALTLCEGAAAKT